MTAGTTFSLPAWYSKRSLRERVALLLGAFVALFLLFYFAAIQPYVRAGEESRRQISALKTAIALLTAREAELNARKSFDPDRDNRLRIEILEREADQLQQQLEANIVNLVSPQDMPGLLKDLLTRKKLDLISLENLPPERLEISPQGTEAGAAPILYRHRLSMTFSGDYLTMLGYLRQLEQFPRAMVWEEVEIETTQYPDAIVRLKVYTLSLTEGWIGG